MQNAIKGRDNSDEVVHETPSVPEMVPEMAYAPVPVTMEYAFHQLCMALEGCCEDSIPDQMRCQEIRGWYANGNVPVAWQAAVVLLEQVLGVKLGR